MVIRAVTGAPFIVLRAQTSAVSVWPDTVSSLKQAVNMARSIRELRIIAIEFQVSGVLAMHKKNRA